MAPANLPFTEPEWKIPGYTGYVQGLQETYKKTPIMAQQETKEPPADSFLYTRTATAPKPVPARDQCNFPENFMKPAPGNLWPRLQTKAAQETCKAATSNIALGDERTSPFNTSYTKDFDAPFADHARLRSPMRNKDLAHTETSLREHYAASYNRVGEKRLAKMISTMRERMSAKAGNNNDNAFRMRKLFKMYDKGETGMVHFEDFRMMGESFGMQLDDDSLLALYHVYDRDGSGHLAYEEVVRLVLDPDYMCMYSPGGVNNTQALADEKVTAKLVTNLRKRMCCESAPEMLAVFESFDEARAGALCPRDFTAACAALGVVLSPKEAAWVERVATAKDGSGAVHYGELCDALSC